MTRFVDLSHDFADGMPGFAMKGPDGETLQYTASIKPFLTHAESGRFYDGRASFEITEITFQTSIGTYMDSPFHRYPEGRDIASLRLDELILPGHVVDVRERAPWQAVEPDEVVLPDDLAGCAVLFNFGWDARWGDNSYREYPFISRALVDLLIARGVKLVGVDTINIDDRHDPERPAHSRLLARDILVVENLCNLASLQDRTFRFFALPLKAVRTAAMPIRAIAELSEVSDHCPAP